MKKYKFRAWNKRWKAMEDWDILKNKITGRDFNEDNLIIMQWTGMKDKNEKAIYEGDICKLTSEEYYSNYYFTVDESWEMTCIVKFDDYTYLLKEIKDKYKEVLLWEINGSGIDIEVIGNVYENPELMKEEE